ncbi:hypothetical protein L7F22_029427 [Adiantum nelumboides]|nr:hypothetical protein [Adiantum nelumboides]
MVSFGSDGAAVMVGSRNGLASLLKKRSPYMVPIHCLAHRTHLCISDAFQGNAIANYVDWVPNELAAMFKKSSKRSARLVELQEAYDCPPLKMERIFKLNG